MVQPLRQLPGQTPGHVGPVRLTLHSLWNWLTLSAAILGAVQTQRQLPTAVCTTTAIDLLKCSDLLQ